MQNYLISPDDCHIVRTFRDAKSLRDAAQMLNCDPAGLLRKVHRIAKDHDLMIKTNGKWVLTKKGHSIANWVEETLVSQKQAINFSTSLKIGTTTWYSEQLVIPGIISLRKIMPEVKEFHVLTPRESEASLLKHEIDFNVTCYVPNDPQITHKKIRKEKWVIVVPIGWQVHLNKLSDKAVLSYLSEKVFIRHPELNLNQVFPQMVNLSDSHLVVDHLVGVRSALMSGLGWSCIPEMLLKHKQFKQNVYVLNKESHMQHEICLSWLRNRTDLKELSEKMTSWLQSECSSKATSA